MSLSSSGSLLPPSFDSAAISASSAASSSDSSHGSDPFCSGPWSSAPLDPLRLPAQLLPQSPEKLPRFAEAPESTVILQEEHSSQRPPVRRMTPTRACLRDPQLRAGRSHLDRVDPGPLQERWGAKREDGWAGNSPERLHLHFHRVPSRSSSSSAGRRGRRVASGPDLRGSC